MPGRLSRVCDGARAQGMAVPKADWVKRLKAEICGSLGRNSWNAQGARDGPLLLLA